MGAAVERVRLGVVGAGNIADMNVAGYLEHPRCATSWPSVMSTRTRPSQRRERWGVPDRLHRSGPACSRTRTSTPSRSSPRPISTTTTCLAPLQAGKHVSVQKPVTNSVTRPGRSERRRLKRGAHASDQRVLRPLPPARAREEARRRGSDRAPDRRSG